MPDVRRARHEAAIELLDRALAYTRGCLLTVHDEHLGRRTPCEQWDLDALLAHMDDALDAFTEGAAGRVHLDRREPVATRVATLQVKACSLLGAWLQPDIPTSAGVGDGTIDTTHLALAAALEITVHGWDVAQTTGAGTPVPTDLAVLLLPVSAHLVVPHDRGRRFAAPRPTPLPAAAPDLLLAFLGRRCAARSDRPTRVTVVPT